MFFLQIVFAGISVGAIYALVGMGLNFTFWTTRVLSFAQGPFLMITVMSVIALLKTGLPLGAGIFLGLVLVSALALLLERLAVRPVLVREGSMNWIVSTLGVGIMLQAFAAKIWGSEAMAFPEIVFKSTDYVELFQIRLSSQMLLVLFSVILIIVVIQLTIHRTLWGKAMKAVSLDRESARLAGINANRVIIGSFVVSGFLAGVAGILIAPISGVDPAFGMDLMLKGFVALIIGGVGSSAGILAGGIALGVVEMLASGYIDAAFKNAISFGLLIIVLVIRPYGLFGEQEVVKV